MVDSYIDTESGNAEKKTYPDTDTAQITDCESGDVEEKTEQDSDGTKSDVEKKMDPNTDTKSDVEEKTSYISDTKSDVEEKTSYISDTKSDVEEKSSYISDVEEKTDFELLDFEEKTDPEADKQFLEEIYSQRSFVRDEMRIVIIGKTGSGKSATGNLLTGKNTFQSTLSASSITIHCQDIMFQRFGRQLLVVDTPGLFDTKAPRSHIDTEIKKCILKTSPGIHAVLLVSRVGRFTKEERKTVEYFKKVFGEGLQNYLMILFTGKDDLDAEEKTVETYVETAPVELKELVAKSGKRYMAINNRAPKEEKDAVAKQLITNIDQMVIANGGKCYTTSMFRKAEALMKKREEEIMKKLEEEKRAEKEALEKSIKEKYDGVMEEQEKKMKSLHSDLEQVNRKGKEEEIKHSQVLAVLESQLVRAEEDRKRLEEERIKNEEKRMMELEMKEQERKEAEILIMIRMEEDRRNHEKEIEEKMKRMDDERKQEAEKREKEIEKLKLEKEQYERKLQAEKERKHFERIEAEHRRETTLYKQMLAEQARELARAQASGNSCIIL